MNQKSPFTLSGPAYPWLICLFSLFFCLQIRATLCAVHPNFTTCEPKSCGDGLNISYPFYIKGVQPEFCGYPNFDLSCSKNGHPIFNLSNTAYVVREILYQNESIRVSDAYFSLSNTTSCVNGANNFTYPGIRFSVVPNQTEMFLFFGCDLQSLPQRLQKYEVGCSAENRTSSVLGLSMNNVDFSYASMKCGSVVRAIVEDGSISDNEGILGTIRRGFLLKWVATNCSDCRSSGGRCGFDIVKYSFQCFCPDGTRSWNCDENTDRKRMTVIVAATVPAAVVGVGVLLIVIYWYRFKLVGLWKNKSKAHQDFEAFLKSHGPLSVRRYSYPEIKKITKSFKEKLGQGGYGAVFKGKLDDGNQVAVKILSESKGNGEEFINEVASISRTSHVNIVTLLGFCFDGTKKALVYEYMPNGSLEKFIYETNPSMSNHLLDTEILYQIVIGVARGLEYLHKGCNTRILHFDIKPHNILLDDNFYPRISDFGLAKICPKRESIVSMLGARGTIGYIAPEVYNRNFGEVSHKSDVYSYGMMILEIVGGRKNINVEVDHTSEIYFPHWIYKCIELNEEFALRNITNDNDRDKTRKMVIISLWCIQTKPADRPTMGKVVEMLEGRVEDLQIPPKPFLSSPPRSPPTSTSH